MENLVTFTGGEPEKRALPRIQATPIKAWIIFSQGRHKQETVAEVCNLTREGIQIATKTELFRPGKRVNLRLFDPKLNSGKAIISGLSASVRYEKYQDDEYRYGMKFLFNRWFGDHSRYRKLSELESTLYTRNQLAL